MRPAAVSQMLNAASVANLVRMCRQTHKGSFCLVEGGEDKAFYRQFFDTVACKIVVAGGWALAVEVLGILEKEGFGGILAVIDADYCHLEGGSVASQNVLVTDFRDLEMVLLASEALERVAVELCDEDLLRTYCGGPTGLRTKLLAASEFLGHFRWFNRRSGLSLKFTSLRLSEFVDRESLALDIPALIRAVKNDSQRHDLDDEYLRTEVEKLRSQKQNLLLVCRGHDVTAVFAVALGKVLGKHQPKEMTPIQIEGRLRVAYNESTWASLRLFNEIHAWEARNVPYRVLPSNTR